MLTFQALAHCQRESHEGVTLEIPALKSLCGLRPNYMSIKPNICEAVLQFCYKLSPLSISCNEQYHNSACSQAE